MSRSPSDGGGPDPSAGGSLTAHIAASGGLLGDVAAFLAVAIRAARTDDPAFAHACYELLGMFGMVFGIPLSLAALLTGVTLGLVSVLLVGALVLGPAIDELRQGGDDAEARLIAGAGYDVAALALATGLSVYKPGKRLNPLRSGRAYRLAAVRLPADGRMARCQ